MQYGPQLGRRYASGEGAAALRDVIDVTSAHEEDACGAAVVKETPAAARKRRRRHEIETVTEAETETGPKPRKYTTQNALAALRWSK